jgi:5'-3' exoribonuclease 1
VSSIRLAVEDWEEMCAELTVRYLKRMAVDLGPIQTVYEVRRQEGLAIGLDGATTPRYAEEAELIPAQLVPEGALAPRIDVRYAQQPAVPADERYKVGSTCLYLGDEHYGEVAIVTEINEIEVKGEKVLTYTLQLNKVKPARAVVGLARAVQDVKTKRDTERYTPAYRAAQSVGCSPLLLSRLTSSITVITRVVGTQEHVEVGLGLKFARKELEIPGYSRRVEVNGQSKWEFSTAAIRMILQFKTAFPDLFRGLERDPNANDYLLTELFYDTTGMPSPDPVMRLGALLDWLRKCPTAKLPLLPCASSSLAATVRCAFADRILHSRMPLDPMHVHLKRTSV